MTRPGQHHAASVRNTSDLQTLKPLFRWRAHTALVGVAGRNAWQRFKSNCRK
jgi:hypothetical protein